MLSVFLATAIALMLLAHAIWMSMFLLDLFFETDRSTAAERARAIWKYLRYGVAIEFSIGLLIVLLIFNARNSFWIH